MLKSTLLQNPEVSREQLREEIRDAITRNVQAAVEGATQGAGGAGGAGREVIVTQFPPVPPLPPGVPTVGVRVNPGEMIPPQVESISIAFFVMIAAIVIGLPIMRAIARRIERGTPVAAPLPPEVRDQLQQISQAVDAIAIEVERISEAQRFNSRILAEKNPELAQLTPDQ